MAKKKKSKASNTKQTVKKNQAPTRPTPKAPASSGSWHPDFEIGVDKLDAQHELLFALVDKLYFLAEKNPDARDPQKKILAEIQDLSEIHFEEEEKLFYDLSYPQKHDHEKEHAQFLRAIESAKSEIRLGVPSILLLVRVLQGWILLHT